MTDRYAFVISDRTGITAETFYNSLVCHFPTVDFETTALPFVDTIEKARDAKRHFNTGLVIGSDQVCVINDKVLGKPGNFDNALKQLRDASGKTVRFLTGLCLYDIESNQYQAVVEPFNVVFRQLTDHQITHYLKTEQPYHCAGSFKSEGLGITLFDKLDGDDPNALVGLPLIQLVNLFNNWNIDVLTAQSGVKP